MPQQVTGFLPEPIPAIPMAKADVARQLSILRARARTTECIRSNVYHALLEADQRGAVINKILEELVGEAAMKLLNSHFELKAKALELFADSIERRYLCVSDEQQNKLFDELTAKALRQITPTGLSLDEALGDVRHFIDLLSRLIAVIAYRLQVKGVSADASIYLDLYHVDLPDDEGISIILDSDQQWDAETAKYINMIKVITLTPWVGRHAISEDWHTFVSFLAGEIREQCDSDQ